jgi:hypothetical protein
MEKDLKEYRKGLIQTAINLNESYDKLTVTLAGGALALSIAFIKDIIKEIPIKAPVLLFMSWGMFIASLTCVFGSILFGITAHKKTLKQVDAGTIYNEEAGGVFSKLTTFLHYSSFVLVIVGLSLITVFIYFNMEVSHAKGQATTTAQNAIETNNPRTEIRNKP